MKIIFVRVLAILLSIIFILSSFSFVFASDGYTSKFGIPLKASSLIDETRYSEYLKGIRIIRETIISLEDLTYTKPVDPFEQSQVTHSLEETMLDELEHAKFKEDISKIFTRVSSKYKLDYSLVGVHVEELNTGFSWVYGNELVLDPTTGKTKGKFSVASAMKFPQAFSTLKYMEDNNISIDSNFKDTLSGNTLNFRTIFSGSVSKSINSNFNYLLRYLGVKRSNEYLEKYGILNSTINAELGGSDPFWTERRILNEYGTLTNSRFTPEDYGITLKRVYEGVQEKNPYMVFLNNLLLANATSDRIPLGIDYKYPVAHKTGTFSTKGKFADVGIVYMPGNPYTISLMTDYQKNVSSCVPFIREMAKEVNRYMETRN